MHIGQVSHEETSERVRPAHMISIANLDTTLISSRWIPLPSLHECHRGRVPIDSAERCLDVDVTAKSDFGAKRRNKNVPKKVKSENNQS
jgi:hypothetical protein